MLWVFTDYHYSTLTLDNSALCQCRLLRKIRLHIVPYSFILLFLRMIDDFLPYWMICCHSLDKRYWNFLRHKGLTHYLLQWNPSCLLVFPRLQDVLLHLSPKQLLLYLHSSWHPMWVACRSYPCKRPAMSLPMPLL